MRVLELWGEAKPARAKGWHANCTERPQLVDSNPHPSHRDATLLTTTPLRCVDNNLLPNKNSNQDSSFHSTLSSAAISAYVLRFSHLTLHKPVFSFFSCPCASLLHFLSFTGRFQLNVAWICLDFSKVLKSHQSCEAWVKWDCHFKKAGITLLCFDTALVSSANIVMHREKTHAHRRKLCWSVRR